jgi:tetratricopeptide (TPR) repeat protein
MNVFPRTALVLISIIAWAAPIHAQPDAEALFREANGLFRSGIYNTALARYREAAAAGLDTPLLHYNVGVVSYKLGQYEEAERSFRRAQASSDLAALAAYNLGLTYRRLGHRSDAEAAFRLAARSSGNRELANLASRAASSLAAPIESSVSTRPRRNARARASRPVPEPVGGFSVLVSARLGQDDNVYRAPSAPYVDLAAPGQPLVTPVVQSASFIPVDVVARYTMRNEAQDTLFRFGYRLDGDFYESDYSNATRISQRFDVGADIDFAAESRRPRRLRSAFYLKTHDETNFDPDDGIDRDINGTDISNRFAYRGAGVETDFLHTLGRWSYGFDLRLEGRQYERAPLVASYDHNLHFLRGHVGYTFGANTTLNLGILKYQRIYDERLARDANGDLLTTNGILEYDYSGLELGVTYRLSRAFEIGADYLRLQRLDAFEGYYDSTQDQLRLRASYRPNRRFRLQASLKSRVYDYPNAFAFNDPTVGPQELDTIGAEIRGEFQINAELSAWAQLVTTDFSSSDPRLAYAQSQSMLGVLWRH